MILSTESKIHFFSSMDAALPGLSKILKEIETSAYLLGAGIFELYALNGWCDDLSRRTSDLDFSIEIYSDYSLYQVTCDKLLALGYKQDPHIPYRYLSPQKIGPYVYVDLLTFTLDQEKTQITKSLMGAGEGFSFKGMDFAKLSPLQLDGSIYVPNPLAFLYLKMTSYRESPDSRLKDFADIFEFIVGAMNKNEIIEELNLLARNSELQGNVKEIKKMVMDVATDSNPSWDFDSVVNQLLLRDNLEAYGHDEFMQFFKLFHDAVFE